ncbi:MAG: DUF3299 domain-containing protein [Verrucomicrobiota bacterium]
MSTRGKKYLQMIKPSVLLGALAMLLGCGCGHPKPKATTALLPPPAVMVARDYQPVSFEALAAFPLKVDWLVNPTNPGLDTLQRTGDIPEVIKSLHGQKVELRGFLKPLQQDASGMREFLLMRGHALCCQTNVPQINEWVHVRMIGPSLPFVPESQFIVRGVFAVGEAMGAGNVVSVYRLAGTEISAAPGTH